ncbi:HNH endonuclease [Prosthecobacter sp.]|uniref:HNH endonuclease n=1 Tax=Prosthecobacter sp. TaxID=1965333 RepID=UPI003782FB86
MYHLVQTRAGERLRCCPGWTSHLRWPPAAQSRVHFEHVVPRTCGGGTTPENLALACPGCNLHKSDRSHATDPGTNLSAPLYHPRQHLWSEHFAWQDTRIIGLTPTGRATISALDLNHPRRLRVRAAEALFDLFPPPL